MSQLPYSVKRSLPSMVGALQVPSILIGKLSDCNILSEDLVALTRTMRVSSTVIEFDAEYTKYCKLAFRRLARPVTISLLLLVPLEDDTRTPMSATSSPAIHMQ